MSDEPSIDLQGIELAQEIEPISSLYVNVDFNDLLDTHAEEEVFELIGKLKDLLGA